MLIGNSQRPAESGVVKQSVLAPVEVAGLDDGDLFNFRGKDGSQALSH
jgi:hypothetical protein